MNLNELIDEMGLLVRHKLKHQNVRLTRDLEPNLPAVMGAAPQLEQAFLNLMLNAAEAMPEGGELKFEASATKDTAELRISDTGAGIPPELRENLGEIEAAARCPA